MSLVRKADWQLTALARTRSSPNAIIVISDSKMPVPTNALANHIAISVSDAEAAVKWYKEVLGLRELVPLQRISTSSPESGPTLKKSG